ncbi:hypothetical protein RCL1_000755 [Eukaryota sp. TZLM3-RCL]
MCRHDSPKGSVCALSIADLFPTQYSVGEIQVFCLKEHLKELLADTDLLLDHWFSTLIPVIHNRNRFYLVDHHHYVRAVYELEIQTSNVVLHQQPTQRIVFARIQLNLDLDEHEFWKEMKKRGYYFAYHNGFAKPPNDFPHCASELHDDPYRSLSYLVAQLGGFTPSKLFYSEFLWADFLRERLRLPRDFDGTDVEILEKALSMVHSKRARSLPGYSKNPVNVSHPSHCSLIEKLRENIPLVK